MAQANLTPKKKDNHCRGACEISLTVPSVMITRQGEWKKETDFSSTLRLTDKAYPGRYAKPTTDAS